MNYIIHVGKRDATRMTYVSIAPFVNVEKVKGGFD
jgi:hypothetical protein